MSERLDRWSGTAPWLTSGGVAVLLAGLGWDALLHRLDPELAAHEGVFSPGNPGHVLFAAGLALTLSGVCLSLLSRLAVTRRWAAVAPVAVLLALGGDASR